MKQNSSYGPEDVVGHIIAEIEILLQLKKRLTEKQFYKDEFLKRAAIRCFEIIGEATNKLPDELKKSNPDIEWKMMSSMRNIMIHDYLIVDYEIVWRTMNDDISEVRKKLKKLKKKLTNV